MTRSQGIAVLSFLLSVPVLIAWAFALFDIATRSDLGRRRKGLYMAVVFFVLPVTLLYLLSRPTSIVRHRPRREASRTGSDWRSTLLTRLEAQPGSPPVMSRSEESQMLERVQALELRSMDRAAAGTTPAALEARN